MAATGYRPYGPRVATCWFRMESSTGDGKMFQEWGLTGTYSLCYRKHWSKLFYMNVMIHPVVAILVWQKTLEKIRSRFYWPGQRKDVENWCKGCEMCASQKSPSTKRQAPLQSDVTGCPLQCVVMDILGPLPLTSRGNKYVLVVGDYFTKWAEAYPMPNMEAVTVAELFVSCLVCPMFFIPIRDEIPNLRYWRKCASCWEWSRWEKNPINPVMQLKL